MAKFTFLNYEMLLFSSNSTVSSAELLRQMLRSIEIPLRFIRLDDHMLSIFGILQELFLTVVVLMSTFKNKNSLRTIEAEIS